MSNKLTYAKAGVSIERANEATLRIKNLVKETYGAGVLSDIGGFGAFFAFPSERYKDPVLVSATDGVGTKLKIAFLLDKHDTVGIDLVAMCANDIIVHGATPLFFLDYIAMGHLVPDKVQKIVEGIIEGCQQASCSLIGGETSEMPDFYKKDEYDLAGFIVGAVGRGKIIDGSDIAVGHKIIGLASSGLHSNGYSLVRKLFFERLKWSIDHYLKECDRTLGQELLIPTRIYALSILNLIKNFDIAGMAHITGGGILGNVARILPQACKGVIKKESWKIPPIFEIIQTLGNVPWEEMWQTFNCGIGLVLVINSKQTQEVMEHLSALKEKPFLIGEVAPREEHEPPVEII